MRRKPLQSHKSFFFNEIMRKDEDHPQPCPHPAGTVRSWAAAVAAFSWSTKASSFEPSAFSRQAGQGIARDGEKP